MITTQSTITETFHLEQFAIYNVIYRILIYYIIYQAICYIAPYLLVMSFYDLVMTFTVCVIATSSTTIYQLIL